MTIRIELAEVIKEHKDCNKLTYDSMVVITGLNKTQLIRIITQSGEGVSIDLMENVISGLGYNISLDVW